MGGVLGLLFEGLGDDLFDERVGDLAWGAGSGFVGESFEAAFEEAFAPLADGDDVDAESRGDGLIVQALGTGQDDPGSCGEALGALGPGGPGFELVPLVVALGEGGFRATTFVHHMYNLQDYMMKNLAAQG